MAFARHHHSNLAYVGALKKNLKIEDGGSSATDPQTAVSNIGGLHRSIINTPNGILGLDSTGKVGKEHDPRIFDTISGPNLLALGETGVYEITNYGSRRTYVISSTDGILTRTNASISFTPALDLISDTATFEVNGRTIKINLNPSATIINKPVILSPGNNTNTSSKYVTIVSSVYRTLNSEYIFKASDWKIAKDGLFSATSLLHQQTLTSGNLNTLFINNDITSLAEDLYVTVRYRGNSYETGDELISAWSDIIKFSTSADNLLTKEIAAIKSTVPTDSGFFGKSVSTASIASDNCVVTAIGDPVNNCVNIYSLSNTTNTLTLEKTLTPSTSDLSFRYGNTVALSPDGLYLAVSSPGFKTATPIKGAVYLYERGVSKNWTLVHTLEGDNSSGLASSENKCIAVSNLGNRVIMAEPMYDSNQGKVILLIKNTTSWAPYTIAVPTAFAGYGQAYFGKDAVAVSSNGNKIAITCRTAVKSFSVLIFKRNSSSTWDYEGQLGTGFNFRGSVDNAQCALEFNNAGTRLAVGLPTTVSVNNETGGRVNIWAFDSSTWVKEGDLYEHGLNIKSSEDLYSGSMYGYSLAFSTSAQDIVFIGSPGYDSNDVNKNIGRVFVYKLIANKWTYSGFYAPSSDANEDKFGYSLSAVKEGDCLTIGVPGSEANVGSVVIYR